MIYQVSGPVLRVLLPDIYEDWLRPTLERFSALHGVPVQLDVQPLGSLLDQVVNDAFLPPARQHAVWLQTTLTTQHLADVGLSLDLRSVPSRTTILSPRNLRTPPSYRASSPLGWGDPLEEIRGSPLCNPHLPRLPPTSRLGHHPACPTATWLTRASAACSGRTSTSSSACSWRRTAAGWSACRWTGPPCTSSIGGTCSTAWGCRLGERRGPGWGPGWERSGARPGPAQPTSGARGTSPRVWAGGAARRGPPGEGPPGGLLRSKGSLGQGAANGRTVGGVGHRQPAMPGPRVPH